MKTKPKKAKLQGYAIKTKGGTFARKGWSDNRDMAIFKTRVAAECHTLSKDETIVKVEVKEL